MRTRMEERVRGGGRVGEMMKKGYRYCSSKEWDDRRGVTERRGE